MARKTKEQKAMESAVYTATQIALNRNPVNVMDLGKIHREVDAAYLAGKRDADLLAAAKAVVAKYTTGPSLP